MPCQLMKKVIGYIWNRTLNMYCTCNINIRACIFFIADVGTAINTENKKMIIMDCRSYSAAVANRAKGGGVECAGKVPT